MPTSRPRCAGFSLIDIMIGLIIGLIVILAIVETLAVFESQQRTTTGGAEASQSGMITLFALQTDIRMAGYGFTAANALACTTLNAYNSGTPQLGGAFLPVKITDGGSGPDRIAVAYSSSAAGGVPTLVVLPAADSSATITVNNAAGYNVGDIILIAVPGSGQPCARLQLTAIDVQIYGTDLQHASASSQFNPPSGQNIYPAGGFGPTPAALVFNMGTFVNNQYQVLCDTLTVSRLISQTSAPSCVDSNNFTSASPVATEVVSIQAQYGIAPAGSQAVNCWVNATAGGNVCDAGDWATPSAANIPRIKAIRVAVVVRSTNPERTNVSAPCTSVNGNVNYGPCPWPDKANMPAPVIDLRGNADWQLYRYKVFETVIPLRNVLWANV